MRIHIIILFIILLHFPFLLFSQNHSPEVSNVNFTQRTDGTHIVDIYYDLYDSDGDELTISVQVSNDNGTSWNFSCENVSGDVGEGITSGTNKHIAWDFGAEHPNTIGDQFRIKIIADDGTNTNGGGEPCPGIPTVTYAGKTYNTVQIGSQCWLRENLNVGTKINSTAGGQQQTDNGVIEKYCYDNDESNCNTYGGLYEWNEMMQYVTQEGAQGICPSGWHIPTLAEFETLEGHVNDEAGKLIDESQNTSGYTATNETGFSALFAGYRNDYDGDFHYLGDRINFWSSTESDSGYASDVSLHYTDGNVRLYYRSKSLGFSVRCLKD